MPPELAEKPCFQDFSIEFKERVGSNATADSSSQIIKNTQTRKPNTDTLEARMDRSVSSMFRCHAFTPRKWPPTNNSPHCCLVRLPPGTTPQLRSILPSTATPSSTSSYSVFARSTVETGHPDCTMDSWDLDDKVDDYVLVTGSGKLIPPNELHPGLNEIQ
jgi:hypothetical protein